MNLSNVLILVLMEDTHWEIIIMETKTLAQVLILVLMEDTHWVPEINIKLKLTYRS